jgi:hypothetical protein
MRSVKPFTVHSFSKENLCKAISNSHFSASDAENHPRASYLYGYLGHLKARRIVVEYPYIDGDYLDDYIAFYANCFSSYERFCKRIHFFDIAITKKHLIDLIQGGVTDEQEDKILKSYLGFIVARPLPKAIIGRTVLKTYEPDKAERGKRFYTVTRVYRPSFFGVEFEVESLAFQEQDKAVAACATVSLWCCFHKTAKLFGTPSPSPALITHSANQIARDSRMLPSQGLSIEQICNAIHHVGLDPEVLVLEEDPIMSIAYSYLHMGLPVIVVAEAIDDKSNGSRLHAVTLTGFSLANDKFSIEKMPTKGQYVDELYGHDDQVGPFSKMHVNHEYACILSQVDRSGQNEYVNVILETPTGKLYKPTHFIIPVYKKIRLSFSDNLKWINHLDAFIRYMRKIINLNSQNLEWDIHLIQVNEYKKYLRESFCNEYDSLILDSLPRFIWRSVLEENGEKILELIADATEMPGSFPIRRIVWHDQEFKGLLSLFIEWSNHQRESLAQEAIKVLTKQFIALLRK